MSTTFQLNPWLVDFISNKAYKEMTGTVMTSVGEVPITLTFISQRLDALEQTRFSKCKVLAYKKGTLNEENLTKMLNGEPFEFVGSSTDIILR